MAPSDLKAVVFDIGETLVDESRMWTLEAERAGVSPADLMAALVTVIERGEEHHELWKLLGVPRPRPPVALEPGDLYPDAVPCLLALHDLGYRVGLAGNQPPMSEGFLRALDLPVDMIGSSGAWGVQKPSTEFFVRVCSEVGLAPHEVAHVGDRLDNDILPANAIGMFTVFLRRGPWGHAHAHLPNVEVADLRIDGLDALPSLLARTTD
jgi:FMN phosphatase YigB (HAD superfamily)